MTGGAVKLNNDAFGFIMNKELYFFPGKKSNQELRNVLSRQKKKVN